MPSPTTYDQKHNQYHRHAHQYHHSQLHQRAAHPQPTQYTSAGDRFPFAASVPVSPPPGPAPPSSSSALISLTQDITALLSLSLEAGASLVNDQVRAALGLVGIGSRVKAVPPRRALESGSGLAVVVVGAADPTGQSLTLRLAKSGYTVFPFVPVNTVSANGPISPLSAPLSTLLLAWSGVQKQLQARDPGHTGAVVPVVIDDSGDGFLAYPPSAPPSPPKRGGRFAHAGETVRAYCRDNGLALVAIVCAAPSALPGRPPRSPDIPHTLADTLPTDAAPIINLPSSSLVRTDEEALVALYRAHVLDPLCVVRALGDLLAQPRGVGSPHGRVLFVETSGCVEELELRVPSFGAQGGAPQMIATARAETARILRGELASAGIDVCEIVVGPMAPRLNPATHVRSSSGDSDTDKALASATHPDYSDKAVMSMTTSRDGPIMSRLRTVARVFAVDDALVYSCVRRAIEDRYPRSRHHAGLVPLLATVVSATPGVGVVTVLGRWVLGRLFAPRKRSRR
ncbi:hypothetical protein Q8F55_001664 [Vanrija albida]|uniref:Uncharacterized protein n=1 Tax=Vanrija albida TaxID=181172 RepID=A0ABR3Q8A8_9TREE